MHDTTSGSSDARPTAPSTPAFGKQTIGWAFDLDETLDEDLARRGSLRRLRTHSAERVNGRGGAGGDLAFTVPGPAVKEAGAVVSVNGVNFATFPDSAIASAIGFFQVDTLIFHGDAVPE